MKHFNCRNWINLLLVLCMGLGLRATAQTTTSVEYDLEPNAAGDSLRILLKRTGPGDFTGLISSITYTLRWPASSPATLGPGTQFCAGGGNQQPYFAEPQVQGAYQYQIYVAIGTAFMSTACPGQSIPDNQWKWIHSIKINNNTGCTLFEIADDAFTVAQGGDPYVALGEDEFLVPIISPAYIGDPNGACAEDCLGQPGGTAVAGTACDDGNPLTTNDTYSAECVCLGEDCNGVAGGTALPGASCDDGDACTTGDVIDANCDCAGTFADADADGTCDANDLCANGPEPGSPCDDMDENTENDVVTAACECSGTPIGTPDCNGVVGGPDVPGTPCDDMDDCTVNDLWNLDCDCVGTFQDSDSDGVCDADDLCPGGLEPGTACDDMDPCTTGDVIGTNCLCAGTFQDADSDGTCDANDVCANGPEPGTACDDMNPNTTGDVVTANCECSGTPVGEEDCEGVIGGPALPGTPCDDQDPNTFGDAYNTNCECVGVPAGSTVLTMEVQTDANGNQTTWEILTQGTEDVACSGGPYASNAVVTQDCTVPNGCYMLRVYDSAGDGMASGTNGGYILRMAGPDGARIIDNRHNFLSGSVSAIANDQGFCLPLSDDRLIFTSCDKLDWVSNQFIVASLDPEVSAEWVDGGSNSQQDANSGYEFWFFDPNGSYSFRWFRAHNTSHGYGTGAARAAHLRINNWLAAFHIPEGVLMNVRVRGRVNGVNHEWGPACRFKIDPVAAQCPTTKLMDIPYNQFLSCGEYREFETGSYVHARPVSGATQYEFRFRQPAEGFEVIRQNTSYFVQLWWTVDPLVDGSQYEVDVRAMKNGVWCPWGEICTLNIGVDPGAQGGAQQNMMSSTDGAELNMWPNPNRGDQLYLSLDVVPEDVLTVTVDMFDMFGKRIMARTVAAQDGFINTVISLDESIAAGMYMVNITAGDKTYTQRLVIQN